MRRNTGSWGSNALLLGAILALLCAGELISWLTADPFLRSRSPVMYVLSQMPDRERWAARLSAQYGVRVDPRTEIEVIDAIRADGHDAVPSFIPRLRTEGPSARGADDLLPLGGISNRLTVLCNEGGRAVTYVSDEHGFHNPRGVWQYDTTQIAAVGRGFVQGYCVPSEANFIALIRRRFPATLNLGMAGEGPLLMLAIIKEYLPAVTPCTVLWFHSEVNDFRDLTVEKQSASLLRYLEEEVQSQNLRARQVEIDRVLTELAEQKRHEGLERRARNLARRRSALEQVLGFAKLQSLRRRLRGTSSPAGSGSEEFAGESDLSLNRRVLSSAKAAVDSWGGTLYFVYLPSWARYDRRRDLDGATRHRLRLRDGVLAQVRELGIPIVDLVPAFDVHPDPISLFPFRGPGHYVEEGHRLVAELVMRSVSGCGRPAPEVTYR